MAKTEKIGYLGRFGLTIKIGYVCFVLQRNHKVINFPVWGDALSISFFINLDSIKRVFLMNCGMLRSFRLLQNLEN